jgi:hypothetical protein
LNQDELKQLVARAAIDEIRQDLNPNAIIGVGTGTTADRFIDLLGSLDMPFLGTVASSERSAERLRARGLRVFELYEIDALPVYVDGADEITAELDMIKGGGGALTREKIVAAAAASFASPTRPSWSTSSDASGSRSKSFPWRGDRSRASWQRSVVHSASLFLNCAWDRTASPMSPITEISSWTCVACCCQNRPHSNPSSTAWLAWCPMVCSRGAGPTYFCLHDLWALSDICVMLEVLKQICHMLSISSRDCAFACIHV